MFRRKTADGSVSALATPGETTRCDADLGAVTEVVSVLDDARTLTGGASDAMSVLCARFDWSCGFYWAADYEGSAMRVVAQAGSVPGDFRAASEGAVLLPGEGVAGRAWKSGDIVVAPLAAGRTSERDAAAERVGFVSVVAVPVVDEGTVAGVVEFLVRDTVELTANRREAVRAIALLLSHAVARFRVDDVQRETLQNTEATSAVMRAITTATSAHDAISVALHEVRQGFGWAYGSFWELDKDNQVLTFDIESGDAGPEFRQVTREATFARGVGLSGRTWESMQLVFVPDLAEVHDCVRAPAARRAGVKSGVCLPIKVAGQFVGTMDFFVNEFIDLSDNRRAALHNTAYLIGQALERFTASEKLATAGRELLTSIEEVERNVISATDVASQGQELVVHADQDVAGLGESSREIGQVVKTIQSIAGQTNLLALNATIEAARAGQAGRGFAVVASEVKELANETERATAEVEQKISAIQRQIEATVKSLAGIREVVEQINETQNVIGSVLTEQVAVTKAIIE